MSQFLTQLTQVSRLIPSTLVGARSLVDQGGRRRKLVVLPVSSLRILAPVVPPSPLPSGPRTTREESQNRVLATSLTSLMRKMHMRQTLSLPIFPFPADFHLRVHPSVRLPVRPARSTCSRQLKSESRKGEDAAKVIMAFHPSV